MKKIAKEKFENNLDNFLLSDGIHALEIWRKMFENSSHISSTSSKLRSFSFQFISVSIWLNLTKSVWSYNQISLVNLTWNPGSAPGVGPSGKWKHHYHGRSEFKFIVFK
jgi:hypothetical protein